jgi:disulfide oxidoreductase YuzD
MYIDGLTFLEGAVSENLVIPYLTEYQKLHLPQPTLGEICFQVDGTKPGLYLYTGTQWIFGLSSVESTFAITNSPDIGHTLVATSATTAAWQSANIDTSTLELRANKDTDTTLAANSDTKYPSQKAVKTYIDNNTSTKESISNKDTDVTLAANSDTKYPSQKAVKAYVDSRLVNFGSLSDFTNALI